MLEYVPERMLENAPADPVAGTGCFGKGRNWNLLFFVQINISINLGQHWEFSL